MEDNVQSSSPLQRNRENRTRLSVLEKMFYASGSVGMATCFMAVGGYLLYVYTDVFYMNPVTAANIFLFTRFWDAINDVIMGSIVDLRIFAKKGKGVYRPWLLIGTPLLVAFFALSFSLPSFITTEGGKVLWCVIFYILYTMAQTVVQVPYGAMSNAITTDTEERGSLGAYRNLGENIAGLIVSASILGLVNYFSKGGTDLPNGWFMATLVLGLIAGVMILICWKTAKERAVTQTQSAAQAGGKIQIKDSLKMLVANRPAVCMVFALLVAAIIINFRFAYLMYYVQSYMGAGTDVVTLLNTTQTLVALVSFWIVNWMYKKMEKRTMLVLCGVLFAVNGVIFMVGGLSVAANVVGSVLFGFLMALSFSTIWGTVPDSVEYGIWKSKICAPAFIFSVVTFAQKCGIGLASWLAGTSLNQIGYTAGQAVSESARNGLFWWHNAVFIVGGILFVLICLPYNLSKARYCEILKELDLDNAD